MENESQKPIVIPTKKNGNKLKKIENKMNIPISKTILKKEEIESVLAPLRSGWLVQGKEVDQFENKWSQFTGAKYSIAVTSCTTALHLSLYALGLKPDDEVIIPAFTWISTANVIEHMRANVVFCDINLDTFNIDENQIEKKITSKTRAIIPVHLFGLPANMSAIKEIANRYNLFVVEDAACGFGSYYNNKHVGNFGDTGCFSFHPRKAITTGEGGMITTNNQALAEKIKILRNHGSMISDLDRHIGPRPHVLPDHPYPGFNYRMTDIQASLGSAQMNRALRIGNERKSLAKKYDHSLKDIDRLSLPIRMHEYEHGYQSYPCLLDRKKINMNNINDIQEIRNNIMDKLYENGVSTRPATHAVHMLEYYKVKYKLKASDFPNAWVAYYCSISIPLFNGMTSDEQSYVIDQLHKYIY